MSARLHAVIALATGDWIQIAGLAVNAGLLGGLIVQLRAAEVVRKQDVAARQADIDATLRRETLDAWQRLASSIRELEPVVLVQLGRGSIDLERWIAFDDIVREASLRRRSANEQAASDHDRAIIEASEAIRAVLNSVDDFVAGASLGAYDEKLVTDLCGWRLARLFQRFLGYVEYVRAAIGTDDAFRSLDAFVTTFLRERQATADDWAPLQDRRTLAECIAVLAARPPRRR